MRHRRIVITPYCHGQRCGDYVERHGGLHRVSAVLGPRHYVVIRASWCERAAQAWLVHGHNLRVRLRRLTTRLQLRALLLAYVLWITLAWRLGDASSQAHLLAERAMKRAFQLTLSTAAQLGADVAGAAEKRGGAFNTLLKRPKNEP